MPLLIVEKNHYPSRSRKWIFPRIVIIIIFIYLKRIAIVIFNFAEWIIFGNAIGNFRSKFFFVFKKWIRFIKCLKRQIKNNNENQFFFFREINDYTQKNFSVKSPHQMLLLLNHHPQI